MSVPPAVILSMSGDSFRMQSHQQIISRTCQVQVGKLADVGVMCHVYIYIYTIYVYNITFDEAVVFQVVFALVGFSYVVGSITGSLGQLRSMSEHTVKDRRAQIVTAEEVSQCDSTEYTIQ